MLAIRDHVSSQYSPDRVFGEGRPITDEMEIHPGEVGLRLSMPGDTFTKTYALPTLPDAEKFVHDFGCAMWLGRCADPFVFEVFSPQTDRTWRVWGEITNT